VPKDSDKRTIARGLQQLVLEVDGAKKQLGYKDRTDLLQIFINMGIT